MKKVFSVLLTAAMLIGAVAVSPVNAYALGEEKTFEKRDVKTVPLDDGAEEIYFTCLFSEELPNVPYVSIEDYFSQIFSVGIEETNDGSGVYTFTNGGYNMVVDTSKDTVTYDCYEIFIQTNRRLPEGVSFETADYSDLFVGDIKGVNLELGKYNIDIIESDGKVYLPYSTMNDIFYDSCYSMLYKKEALQFVVSFTKAGTSAGNKYSDFRDKAIAEYTYNELCLVMDNCYGKPSNAILAESIGKIGFDKTLETYNKATARVKELLLSQDPDEFLAGIRLLDYYMDDGGHTSISDGMTHVMEKKNYDDIEEVAKKYLSGIDDEEIAAISQYVQEQKDDKIAASRLSDKKFTAYSGFRLIERWTGGIRLYQTGDTFIFDFSSFDNNVIEPFKWSMDYAAEHHAKYFLIDVTTNTGGDPKIAAYMVSLIYGADKHAERVSISGNLIKPYTKMDKNLDGVIDEKDDEVKYDFHCAIIESRLSYSCANHLPVIAQDNGVAIIGEKSSGGSYNIMCFFFPDGCSYSLSASMGTTHSDGRDADDGAVPNIPMPAKEAGYEGFYDLSEIKKGLSEFYNEPFISGKYGDLDDDDKITSADSLLILRQSVNLEKFTGDKLTRCDVDCDGKVSSADALEVLRYSVNLPTTAVIG